MTVVEDEVDKSFWGELESESSEEESEEEEEEERDIESGLVTPGETSVSLFILSLLFHSYLCLMYSVIPQPTCRQKENTSRQVS